RRRQLESKRQKIYSQELNQLHAHLSRFRNEQGHLVDLLQYLQQFLASGRIQLGDREFSHVVTLLRGWHISGNSGDIEKKLKRLVNNVKRRHLENFSRQHKKAFHRQWQAFCTAEMDAASFLQNFVHLAEAEGLELELDKELQELLTFQKHLLMLRGRGFVKELEAFLHEASRQLAKTPQELKLIQAFERLDNLEHLARLEWTLAQMQAYHRHPQAFKVLMGTKSELLEAPLQFYQLVRKRDTAMLENLKKILQTQKVQAIAVLAGGFHAEGLKEGFNKLGVSYVLITPRIKSFKGQKTYHRVMQGELSYRTYLRTTFYDAFIRHASEQLVADWEPREFRENLITWRNELIRQLALKQRLTELGRYLPYLEWIYERYVRRRGHELTVSTSQKARIAQEIVDGIGQYQREML
ncbi:hypothetical protein D6817_05380, partial [Candidatus Pacearchaeota archaeon]